jgi:hypothetical protein
MAAVFGQYHDFVNKFVFIIKVDACLRLAQIQESPACLQQFRVFRENSIAGGHHSIALASALSLALPVNADRPLHQKQDTVSQCSLEWISSNFRPEFQLPDLSVESNLKSKNGKSTYLHCYRQNIPILRDRQTAVAGVESLYFPTCEGGQLAIR